MTCNRARSGSLGFEFFDELAVMVHAFLPLQLGEGGRASDGACAARVVRLRLET
jgi:hypothetical protein